jgi:hypothetical protein
MKMLSTEGTEAQRTRRRCGVKTTLAAILALALVAAPLAVNAQKAERWLHVKVEKQGDDGETVKVNVPLSLAEKVLAAVRVDKLNGGKLRIEHAKIEGVDLKALLEAVRDLQDNEFVTIEGKRENVRVSKSGGYILVKVREGKELEKTVDVKIPMTVVEALVTDNAKEVDLAAAVRALAQHGDFEFVSVRDGNETVRVWVDSRNTQ